MRNSKIQIPNSNEAPVLHHEWLLELGIWNFRPPSRSERNICDSFGGHYVRGGYAKANCSEEDSQVGGQTLQDYGPRKDFAGTKLAPSFAFVQACEAQTSAWQNRARG